MERKFDEAKKPECRFPNRCEVMKEEPLVELLADPIYRYFGWYSQIKNKADATKVANFIVEHIQQEGYIITKKDE